eukprot:g72513.t1
MGRFYHVLHGVSFERIEDHMPHLHHDDMDHTPHLHHGHSSDHMPHLPHDHTSDHMPHLHHGHTSPPSEQHNGDFVPEDEDGKSIELSTSSKSHDSQDIASVSDSQLPSSDDLSEDHGSAVIALTGHSGKFSLQERLGLLIEMLLPAGCIIFGCVAMIAGTFSSFSMITGKISSITLPYCTDIPFSTHIVSHCLILSTKLFFPSAEGRSSLSNVLASSKSCQ